MQQNSLKPFVPQFCSHVSHQSVPPIPDTSSPRLKTAPPPHPPPLRLGSPCLLPSSLLGCLCHSESLCLSTQTGLPAALLLVPITTGSKMQAQEQVPFQGGEATGTLPNPKLSPRQMTLSERPRLGQSCRHWGLRGSSDKGTQALWRPLQSGTHPEWGWGGFALS